MPTEEVAVDRGMHPRFGVDVRVRLCVLTSQAPRLPPPRRAGALAGRLWRAGSTGAASALDTLWAWQDPGVSCGDSGSREDERNLWKSGLGSGEGFSQQEGLHALQFLGGCMASSLGPASALTG